MAATYGQRKGKSLEKLDGSLSPSDFMRRFHHEQPTGRFVQLSELTQCPVGKVLEREECSRLRYPPSCQPRDETSTSGSDETMKWRSRILQSWGCISFGHTHQGWIPYFNSVTKVETIAKPHLFPAVVHHVPTTTTRLHHKHLDSKWRGPN
ncbi:hypothetical protein BT69DRAFT_1005844 [Atractiella rhizophila]|nr:hypothetical protein BT69DRAFT_1005844 [Atractiella rhizophila]